MARPSVHPAARAVVLNEFVVSYQLAQHTFYVGDRQIHDGCDLAGSEAVADHARGFQYGSSGVVKMRKLQFDEPAQRVRNDIDAVADVFVKHAAAIDRHDRADLGQMLQQVLQEQWIAATALMKPLGGITKVRPRTDAIEVLADCLDVERGKRQLDALEMCAQLTGQLRKRRLRMVPPLGAVRAYDHELRGLRSPCEPRQNLQR